MGMTRKELTAMANKDFVEYVNKETNTYHRETRVSVNTHYYIKLNNVSDFKEYRKRIQQAKTLFPRMNFKKNLNEVTGTVHLKNDKAKLTIWINVSYKVGKDAVLKVLSEIFRCEIHTVQQRYSSDHFACKVK